MVRRILGVLSSHSSIVRLNIPQTYSGLALLQGVWRSISADLLFIAELFVVGWHQSAHSIRHGVERIRNVCAMRLHSASKIALDCLALCEAKTSIASPIYEKWKFSHYSQMYVELAI